MNKVYYLLPLLILLTTFSCEQKTKEQKAADKKFAKTEHSNYKPLGEEKWLPTGSGPDARIYHIVPKEITGRVLFVFHERWGLNNQIKQICDRYSRELDNTMIIGIDLFDGVIPLDADQADKLLKNFTQTRATQILGVVTSFAGATSRIATIGWGFGGSWSLEASTMITHQGVGCVMYYGTPPKNAIDLAPLRCDILGIYGTKDQWITAEMRQNFETNCKITRKKLTLETFDAKHGFANPDDTNYIYNTAQIAHAKALTFLRKKLE